MISRPCRFHIPAFGSSVIKALDRGCVANKLFMSTVASKLNLLVGKFIYSKDNYLFTCSTLIQERGTRTCGDNIMKLTLEVGVAD